VAFNVGPGPPGEALVQFTSQSSPFELVDFDTLHGCICDFSCLAVIISVVEVRFFVLVWFFCTRTCIIVTVLSYTVAVILFKVVLLASYFLTNTTIAGSVTRV